uniref:Uncharacterized protein n=1 Tax=Cannabis sativa TaxID=3483 RepID=A0A803QR83_CANSA
MVGSNIHPQHQQWLQEDPPPPPTTVGTTPPFLVENSNQSATDERASTIVRTSSLRSRSPDYEIKEIKNIYVDFAGGKCVARPKIESLTSPKVSPHLDTKETDDLVTKKPSQAVEVIPIQ